MILLSQMPSVPPPCRENMNSVTSIGSGIAVNHGAHAIDFKGEAMTFKATTAGVLDTLQHCLELLGQREDTWRRRLEREVERRRKVEELYQTARQEAAAHRLALHGSPDYEVGCLLHFRSRGVFSFYGHVFLASRPVQVSHGDLASCKDYVLQM